MEIKDWLDLVSKGLLRIALGVFLVFSGLSIYKASMKEPKDYSKEVYYIGSKQNFNKNEEISKHKRDSVLSLPIDKQLEYFKELADSYE